ncbi:MAG: ArnT family glycosyltransferase [bacterium]
MHEKSTILSWPIILLAAILLLAALLRVPLLSRIPNGFYHDEAVNGYDSYSILKTGRDPYGECMPLFLRALNDYRESLYVVLTIPSVAVFGLNEFATRFPAALIGIATVLALYFLTKALFNEKVGLIAALLLAISPWHIQFSRIAFRAILFPFFFCLGLFFFIRSMQRPKHLYASVLFFGVSLHTYMAARVFVPLFLLGLTLMYRKTLWSMKKHTLTAAVIFMLIVLPLFRFWISPQGMARARPKLGKSLSRNITNYFSYFRPCSLFCNGDPNLRHSIKDYGQLYIFEFLTIVIGLFFLIAMKREHWQFFLLWLLLYPIPAAFTGSFHALRSIIGAPLFSIVSAYGIVQLADLSSSWNRTAFLCIIVAVIGVSLAMFTIAYFVDYPQYSGQSWEYGVREAILFAEKSRYTCVMINEKDFPQVNYHILLYTRYDPATYQKNPIYVSDKKYTLGKYHVIPLTQEKTFNKDCLFILRPWSIQELVNKGYKWHTQYIVKDLLGRAAVAIGSVS